MNSDSLSCFWFPAAAAVGLALCGAASASTTASARDILDQSRAVYAGLASYADRGRVETELGPSAAPVRERYTFETRYRGPRHFRFVFDDPQSADRYVVWSDDSAFHTWWKATGVESTYAKGQGANALLLGDPPTRGSLLLLAPLLFPQAGLAGTLTELDELRLDGTETVGGRACHKLVGVARSVYPATGRVTNVRDAVVWIDTESLLVRQILVEAAAPPGHVHRVRTTFEPQANPPFGGEPFVFEPPPRR